MRCERCFKETLCTTMSMFNTQTICMDCKGKERAHPRYKEATDTELAAVQAGNRNFAGIGLPADLK